VRGTAYKNGINGYNIELHEETTLRDQFAMADPVSYVDAIVQCGWERTYRPESDAERATVWAVLGFMRYEYADAMLAMRAAGGGK